MLGWRVLTGRLLSFVVLATVAACGQVDAGTRGGTVSVLGSWEGPELTAFRAVVEPFEQRTGIQVDYRSTRDLNGVLTRDLSAGVAPDLAGLPGPAYMTALARSGALLDLRDVVELGQYKAETAPAFVDLGTVDGRLVGVFIKATVKGLLWYNASVYKYGVPISWPDLEQQAMVAATGSTKPWCVGLESGATSGWPGTDWIEDFLLRQSGPEAYDAWVGGALSWESVAVRRAFQSYGRIVAEGNVYGGADAVVHTYFGAAGRPLFTDPPGCLFLHQGSFMAPFLKDDPAHPSASYDFLSFPEIDPRFAGSVIGAGDLFAMIHDTPQARALMRYLVTAEAQSIWVAQGGALSGNNRVHTYPNRISERMAALLTNARVFRFDASDSMPDTMNAAFWQAVLDYTQDQGRLDEILAHLDAVRARAYVK